MSKSKAQRSTGTSIREWNQGWYDTIQIKSFEEECILSSTSMVVAPVSLEILSFGFLQKNDGNAE